jgi:hypothetical protein
VESAEQQGAEVKGPDTVVDFLQADVLLEQAVADVDPAFLPADAAVLADLADFEVSGVLGLRQAIGEGSRGGLVEVGGQFVLKRLVRPLVVELEAEGVEEALLGSGVFGKGRAVVRGRPYCLKRRWKLVLVGMVSTESCDRQAKR